MEGHHTLGDPPFIGAVLVEAEEGQQLGVLGSEGIGAKRPVRRTNRLPSKVFHPIHMDESTKD